MTTPAPGEKSEIAYAGASNGMNLTRFDSLMGVIFESPLTDDGHIRQGPNENREDREGLGRTELLGVVRDSDLRSSRQSPWHTGVEHPSFNARSSDGREVKVFGGCAYSHHDDFESSYAGYSSTAAAMIYGTPISGAHYATAASTANYGTALPTPMPIHTQLGYPMHPLVATRHGMHGNYGPMSGHMEHIGMPHSVGYDFAPGGTVGGALQESTTGDSYCKATLAAAARAARSKKLRDKRNDRMILPAANVGPLEHPTTMDVESSPGRGRGRGRRYWKLNNRDERRIRNRASVQLCRQKKRQRFEGLEREKELYESEHLTMNVMAQRHRKTVRELRNLIPPQVAVMLDDATAFINTPPRNRRTDFDD